MLGEFCFGDVWARDGLDLRTRRIVTLTTVATLSRPKYLRTHIRAALEQGFEPSAWQKEHDASLLEVNDNGGAIALGHPLAARGPAHGHVGNECTGGRWGTADDVRGRGHGQRGRSSSAWAESRACSDGSSASPSRWWRRSGSTSSARRCCGSSRSCRSGAGPG